MRYVIITIILLGFGYYWYQMNVVRYQYEGAETSGYYFPDEVRNDISSACLEAFQQKKETLLPFMKDRISDSQIENICSCFLDELEETYSYKEFDKKYLRKLLIIDARAKFMGQTPQEFKSIMNSCAQKSRP